MQPGLPDPETGRRRVRVVQTGGSSRGPEEPPTPIDPDEVWEGMEQPLLDFPVYGCDDTWTGPRWLEFIQNRSGEGGEGADEVWLSHSHTRSPVPNHPSIRVMTLPYERFTRLMGHPGEDELRTIAFQTAFALIDGTVPELPYKQRQRFHRADWREMDRRADDYAAWTTVSWDVDGRPATARITEWAGAWAGFTVDVPEVALIVMANAVSPDSIRLRDVTDDPGYDVDFRRPLNFPSSLLESAAAALGPRADVEHERWPLHADHETLLRS